MARPSIDDEDEKPLDPAVEKVRRKLVRFVAINLGLLFVALMAVVSAVVYKSRSSMPPAVAGGNLSVPVGRDDLTGTIALPAGAKLLSQSLDGDRITLAVQLADGSQAIFLYAIGEGRIVGRFEIAAE